MPYEAKVVSAVVSVYRSLQSANVPLHLERAFTFGACLLGLPEFLNFGSEAKEFLHELGYRLAQVSTLELKSLQFLIQRILVAVQRGNAIALLGTFTKDSLLQNSTF